MTVSLDAAPEPRGEPADLVSIYAEQRLYLWNTLYRLGVREADLQDALQEVLVVVHRRLASFNGQSKLTTWLFGICLRVAAAHRRRGFRRHECPTDLSAPEDEPPDSTSPERVGRMLDARARLNQILDSLQPELRAVFVMFELEGINCATIAAELGLALGTVHSRLHTARKAFANAAQRQLARERSLERHVLGGAP